MNEEIEALAEQRRAMLVPPPVLYHYCSAGSLIGILQSGRIWAGDALVMNDSQELVYSRKVAARVAARLLEDRELRPQTDGETLLREVAQEKFHYWQWDRYFIACFTENADQLSQWRAYADDGLGYAVGFRGHARWATGGPRPVQLERVIYDEDAQDALLEPILRHAASTPEGANHFLARLWSVLAIIKNPAFREEREWRLVVQDWPGDPSDFHYVPSRFGVAAKMKLGCVKSSYRIESAAYPFDLTAVALQLPLVHIVAGPRILDTQAVYHLSTQCGYWSRYETLEDAVSADTGVHLSSSAASYR